MNLTYFISSSQFKWDWKYLKESRGHGHPFYIDIPPREMISRNLTRSQRFHETSQNLFHKFARFDETSQTVFTVFDEISQDITGFNNILQDFAKFHQISPEFAKFDKIS